MNYFDIGDGNHHLIVTGARDLQTSHRETLLCDPYFQVKWGVHGVKKGYVIDGTTNPLYPDLFFPFTEDANEVSLFFFDREDWKKDAFLGKATILVDGFREFSGWVDLTGDDDYPHIQVLQGKVHVILFYGSKIPSFNVLKGPSFGRHISFSKRELLDSMQTGDLLFYAGDSVVSHAILTVTNSVFSHVGLLFRLKGDDNTEGIYSAEMIEDAEGCPDFYTPDQKRRGMPVMEVDYRLRRCEGPAIWFAKLKTPLSREEKEKMEKWLKELHDKDIEYNTVQMVANLGVSFGVWHNKEDESKLFCSQMVAAMMKLIGRVDSNVNSSEVTPDKVMKLGCWQEPILIRWRIVHHE